jgi:hypothetical protein
LAGQEGSQKDSSGQVSGDAPETGVPEAVIAAGRYLAVLRAEWDLLDGALADELIQGTGGGR